MVVDSATGITTKYYYDFTGRTMKYTESASGYSHSVGYDYDDINNLISQVETINGTSHTTTYDYDEDNRVTSKTTDGITVSYTYDALGRVTQQVTKNGSTTILTESYTYTANSSQIATYRTVSSGYDVTYTYTYDDNGNILTVSDGTNTTSYVYDSQNQLIRENNQAGGFTHVWVYDNAGNIQSRTEYAYTEGTLENVAPTDTVLYGYGEEDANWRDQLLSYDGTAIEYDKIGNPESYRDKTLTWKHGRELATLSDGTTTWTYTYDAGGMRTKRTDGTNTYSYVYNGSQLVQMTVGENTLYFTYDSAGIPATVTYNGTVYYYTTNVQGDITGILKSDGTQVVTYAYDAWGNILSCTGSMADTLGAVNPLRYRGYVYDQETGLYYLQSRYYDPELGRFISADEAISSVGGDLLGYNQFAYCFNNPVNMDDSSGNWPKWATIALGAVAAVAAVAVTVATLGAAAPAAACTLTMIGTSLGASFAVAKAVATVAVVTTTVVASAYAGDAAYSAVTGESLLLDTVFQGNTEAYNAGAQIASIATMGMVSASAQNPGVCFVEGTLVATAEGYTAIEKISTGDMVWAWDEETGEKALKPVVETYVNETSELIHVFINNEEIITTPEHPFYSPVKGWTNAAKLRAGDILVLLNGKYVVVEKIQHEILETPITVYNFQVADFHTYYVANIGVLVHNSCNHTAEWNKERRSYWKSTAQNAVENQDYGAYIATSQNIDRMSRGLAPIGWDGFSVQLHHWQGIAKDFFDYSAVSKTLHQLIHLFE